MGQARTYTDEQFIEAVKSSFSVRQVLRKLGLREAGGNYKLARIRIEKLGLNIEHWGDLKNRQGWSKGKKFPSRYKTTLKEIMIENSFYANTNKLKKRLFKEGIFEEKCCCCGNIEWMGKPIPLEMDHINGNNRDHRLENLRILCPNCHAQTPTYCSKNKNRLSEEKIKEIDGKRMAFLFQEIEGQVENKKVFPAKRKTIIDAEEVRKLGETFTTKEIAEQLGVPEGSLRKYLSAKKISIADKHKEKFSPTKEELEKLVNEKPMTEIGKMFGVSDNAIRKRCKKLGIELPKNRLGYWAKVYAGKEVASPPNPNDRETIDFSSL